MSLGTLLQLMDPLAIQRREDSYKDADRGRRSQHLLLYTSLEHPALIQF
jgi:hypothetical protein